MRFKFYLQKFRNSGNKTENSHKSTKIAEEKEKWKGTSEELKLNYFKLFAENLAEIDPIKLKTLTFESYNGTTDPVEHLIFKIKILINVVPWYI